VSPAVLPTTLPKMIFTEASSRARLFGWLAYSVPCPMPRSRLVPSVVMAGSLLQMATARGLQAVGPVRRFPRE
jgi:hypothetical protein